MQPWQKKTGSNISKHYNEGLLFQDEYSYKTSYFTINKRNTRTVTIIEYFVSHCLNVVYTKQYEMASGCHKSRKNRVKGYGLRQIDSVLILSILEMYKRDQIYI